MTILWRHSLNGFCFSLKLGSWWLVCISIFRETSPCHHQNLGHGDENVYFIPAWFWMGNTYQGWCMPEDQHWTMDEDALFPVSVLHRARSYTRSSGKWDTRSEKSNWNQSPQRVLWTQMRDTFRPHLLTTLLELNWLNWGSGTVSPNDQTHEVICLSSRQHIDG